VALKDKFAVVGLGITKQGRIPGVSSNGLYVEAINMALEDSGVSRHDINGFVYQQTGIGGAGFATGDVPRNAGLTDCRFIWAMQTGGVTATATVQAACALLESGAANYVIIGYSSTALSQKVLVGGSAAERSTPGTWGHFGPGADHALAARRHMHLYGTTHRQMGAIAVNQRDNANKRPDAMMYGRPMTLEDHANSRIISEPLHMFDFCLVSDGACAIIITTAERAKTHKKPPVYIMGLGFGHQVITGFRKEQYTTLEVAPSKAAAFKEAGVDVKDIDVAELYDCFTITVLLELEDYGFCRKGEGGPFIESGAIKVGGQIPVNTSGNELSWGYMQGYTALCEGIKQMRGEGGGTQVKDAEVCLVSGHGGTGTGSMQYAHGTCVLRR